MPNVNITEAVSTGLLLVVFVIDAVSLGQHALMQDSRNQNTTLLKAVEYDVLAMLMSSQGRANVLAQPAQCRIVRKHLATSLKLADVPRGLGLAPSM